MIINVVFQVGDKVTYTARGGTQSACTITAGPYGSSNLETALYDATRDSDGMSFDGHLASYLEAPGKFSVPGSVDPNT